MNATDKKRYMSDFRAALNRAQANGSTDQLEEWAERMVDNFVCAANGHKDALRKVENFEQLVLLMQKEVPERPMAGRDALRFWLAMFRSVVPGMRAKMRVKRP